MQTKHASCLCGGVRIEIEGAFVRATHCHCSMCRKSHGAAFATYGTVKADRVKITAGEELITRYASSPGVARWFCSRCGSNLRWFSEKHADLFEVPYGLLDDDPQTNPSMHIFTQYKAPWYDIADALPQK